MAAITYKGYRVEIRPVAIPGGWSAQVHVWSFHSGTTRMVSLTMPTHIAFVSAAAVYAYAEKLATEWVEQALGVCGSAMQEAAPSQPAAKDRRQRQRRIGDKQRAQSR